MNGAVYDSTINIFFKMRYAKTYDAMLATSLGPLDVAIGEIGWALIRGAIYAAAFEVVMLALGLITSPWAVLAVPAAVLIAFGFAAVGMAVTTWIKTFQQLDWVTTLLLPMFLFSTTFFPLDVYPRAVQIFVQCFPLYHGIELMRGLTLGAIDWGLLGPRGVLRGDGGRRRLGRHPPTGEIAPHLRPVRPPVSACRCCRPDVWDTGRGTRAGHGRSRCPARSDVDRRQQPRWVTHQGVG